MSVPVEAQSLSALTNLFANPPQYPRNPTHDVREPLVLYIVRVPGSKDVFLTPIKPPTKASISLEAIQSSLYYLHVESAEDEEVRQSIDQQRESEAHERKTQSIHRKPLPQVPYENYPLSARPLPPPKSYPSYQPGLDGDPNASQSERYASRGAHIKFKTDRDPNDLVTVRKPLSPIRTQNIPQHQDSDRWSVGSFEGSTYDSSSQPTPPNFIKLNIGLNSDVQYYAIPDNHISRSTSNSSDHRTKNSMITQTRFSMAPSSHLTTITLIRRDPVSGSQWNVGTILVHATKIVDAPLNPVSIEITTPGYTRFASAPERPRSGISVMDADSIKEAISNGRLCATDPNENSHLSNSFVRKVGYQQQLVHSRPFKLHHRTDSSDSMTKPPSPSKQMRQVLSFASPWQGICSFSNGIDGRSLKCRHTLTPLSPIDEDTTANIAELRFNLPWSVVTHSSDRMRDDGTLPISQLLGPRPGKETIKRGLQHFKELSRDLTKELKDRKAASEDRPVYQDPLPPTRVEHDMERLSLKLGREKAGGGFKGTSAKLGKLIIEDEGLKMCDLVVAACMGIWWQHYDSKDE